MAALSGEGPAVTSPLGANSVTFVASGAVLQEHARRAFEMSVRAQLSELPSNKATKALAVMYDTYAGDPGDAAAVQRAVSVLLERQQPETCTAKVAAAVHAERLLREALGSSQARTAQHLSTYAAVLGLTNLTSEHKSCNLQGGAHVQPCPRCQSVSILSRSLRLYLDLAMHNDASPRL